MRTVGELKKFIENLDDNMLLVRHSNNFELMNSIVEEINPEIRKFSISKQKFMDAFDYEYYYTDIYKDDQLNGKECLLIV